MGEGLIGNYRVGRKLGEGGMGTVYLVEHALLGRKAALKVLLPSLSADPDIVNRFFNEARAATAIADPGIVQIFDFGIHTDGSAYIVMELLEGEPLDHRLRRVGRLSQIDALRIIRQCALSLQAAHTAGIVHRDLKPENIYLVVDAEVASGERCKILDFGIAKLGHSGGGEGNRFKTRTGALMGTPMYMSPEQCRGAGDIDHRSDIYALGCVLFHLLVGRPLFDGEGMGEIIASHLREPPPPPSTLVDGLRPEVEAIVLRCLAKAPADRFQHMSELVQAIGAIERFLTAPPGMAVAPPWAHTSYISQPPGTMTTPPPGAMGSQPGTSILPGGPSLTTLGSTVGQRGTQVPARRRGWWLAAVAVLAFGGGALGVVATRRDVAAAVTPPPAPSGPATTAVDAQPAANTADPAIVPVDAGVPLEPARDEVAPPLDAAVDAVVPSVDAGGRNQSRRRRRSAPPAPKPPVPTTRPGPSHAPIPTNLDPSQLERGD